VPDKNEVAMLLAEAHRNLGPTINRIIRLRTAGEEDAAEPVKLLEVNPATSPSGILPNAFSADPPHVPFHSVVVEVTEAELAQIHAGELHLPAGWTLAETLYPAAA
jgi:hypothetical protein